MDYIKSGIAVDLFTDEIGVHQLLNLLRQLNLRTGTLIITEKKWQQVLNQKTTITNEFQDVTILKSSNDFQRISGNSLGLCLGISEKIPLTVIEKYHFGILNFHLGKLPVQKGANTVNWLIINGEKETELTLHVMTQEIDSGPVLHAVKIPIDFEDTAVDLLHKMCLALPEFKSSIKDYLNGTLLPLPQKKNIERYFRRRTPEDGEFNWSMSNMEIYNKIRGLVDPWPGAFFYDKKGNKVLIHHRLDIAEIESYRQKHEIE